MAQVLSEEQIAALREKIRRAGTVTRWLRLGVAAAPLVSLITATVRVYCFFNAAYINAATGPEEGEALFNGLATLLGFPASVLVSLVTAWVAAIAYREVRSSQLRRAIQVL